GDGNGELDVAHALAPNARQGHFDAAPVADHTAIADALVLPAMALPVLDRTENALAEEAVLFGLERPIVDGFGRRDFTPRPPIAEPLHLEALAFLGVLGTADFLWRGDPDLDEVEARAARLAHAAAVDPVLLLSVAVAVHAIVVGRAELDQPDY